MNIRIIRKAISLLIVDVIIIIGIFVLQFRTDSSIIEKIENLQLPFSQTEDAEKADGTAGADGSCQADRFHADH